MAHTKGSPPKTLTGQLPVSSQDSPWWDGVASELRTRVDLVGRTLTIEELTQTLPSYEDGRRPRPRAAARRLLARGAVELVLRGPNDSLGRGATYRVVEPIVQAAAVSPPPDWRPTTDAPDDELRPDMDWLEAAVERMTKPK